MESGGKYSQFVNVIKGHENVNLGNVKDFLKANYGEDVMGNYRTKQGIDGLAGALQNAFDEARGTEKPGDEPVDGTDEGEGAGEGSPTWDKEWKNKLAGLLGDDQSLGTNGLTKFLEQFPDVAAEDFDKFLTKNFPDASILEGFAGENEYGNLTDLFKGFKDNLNDPDFGDPDDVTDEFDDYNKDDYNNLKKKVKDKAGFFEALYSGEGGKNTDKDGYQYDISGPQAKAYLQQLAISATQRMEIDPREYGRTKGATPVMETIKLADGTKVERFSGKWNSDLGKLDNMSLAERYDAGNKTDGIKHDTRKQMFKELSANYDNFADKMVDKLADKNAPATKYLTGFGTDKDGNAEFGYDHAKANLKALRATQEDDRTKVKQAAKALGVQKINETTEDAIERLTGSITGIRDSMDLGGTSDFKTSLSSFNEKKGKRKDNFANQTNPNMKTQFL